MIQPKIPVPLNLPRLQPVHGFSAPNSLSTGTPISPLIPSSSSLASVAITQLPTPQFYPTTGCVIGSPVSPQFLTPQPPSTQLSPVIPLSPAMFQVCIYIRPHEKRGDQKLFFFISHRKHMLWVLKRTVSMRRFF